jgi:hypothetical protein
VKEGWVGFEDAVAEEGVGGVDGAAEAEGGVYPVAGVGMRLMVFETRETYIVGALLR